MCNVILNKKMMAPQLCQLGVRAKCSCLSWFMHPSQHIRDKYPNPVSGHCLEGCLTIRQEVKKVSRQDQLCIIIHHDDFKMADGEFIKLHAIKQYFKVTEEGDPDLFFLDPGEAQGQDEAPPDPLPDVVGELLNGQSEMSNTLEAFHGIVNIDDNNEPAPENVPAPTDDPVGYISTDQGHNGFCFRRINNMTEHHARLKFPCDPTNSSYYLHLFEGLFPKELVLLIIDKVNETIDGEKVTDGEFLHWIGLWLLMFTVDGTD